MAITIVQDKSSFSPPVVQNVALTFSSAVTVGNTILLGVCSRYPVATVIDNKSNSYGIDGQGSVQGGYVGVIRALVGTGGAGFQVIVTFGGVGEYVIWLAEISASLLPDKTSAGAGLSPLRPGQSESGLFGPGPVIPLQVEEIAIANCFTPGGANSDGIGLLELFFSPLTLLPAGTRGNGLWWGTIAEGVFVATNNGALNPLYTTEASGQLWVANLVTYYEHVLATFTGAPTSGVAPLSVTFDPTGSTGYSLNYFWDFGDGQNSTTQAPTHSYATAGSYNVTLTVSNAANQNVFTRSAYITVSGGTSGGGIGVGVGQPYPGGPIFGPPMPGTPFFAQQYLQLAAPADQFTSDEAADNRLVADLIQSLQLAIQAEAGLEDAARLEQATRAVQQALDGLLLFQVAQQESDSIWSLITGGQGDRDEPEDGEFGDDAADGELWIKFASKFQGRRRKLPPAPSDDTPATIWVCVVDQNGLPQWFELQLYRAGATTA